MHDNDKPMRGPWTSVSALDHLWSLSVNPSDIVSGPLRIRWEFFDHAAKLPWNPEKEKDRAHRDMLTRALLAEVENKDPLEEV